MRGCNVFLIAITLLFCAPATFSQEKVSCSDGDNRSGVLWTQIKESLQRPDGALYFQQIVDAEIPPRALPPFVGTVVSGAPIDRPTALIISLSNSRTLGEVTLQFDNVDQTNFPNEAIVAGTKLAFYGIIRAYQTKPFMLTLSESAFSVCPAAQ